MKHATLITALLLAVTAGRAAAQAEQQLVVPLTDAGRPAVLDVSLVFGSISVTGYDGDEIVIRPDEPYEHDDRDFDDEREARRQGLRRIPNTSLGLVAEEHDNTVTVSMDFSARSERLAIAVPRETSVRAGTVNNGDVTVVGVRGEHELSNVNGDITATDLEGSVVVNTTNGDVHVELTDVAPDKAMSFTSFNGDMDVSFPADLSADLRISTNRGDVYTDFEVTVQPQPAVVDRSDNTGRYRVRLERDVRAVVGSGGPEIRFRTFNGDIFIRRR